MAGFKRNNKYFWCIDLGDAGFKEFEGTADKAWKKYAQLCTLFRKELPMYCNGELVNGEPA